MKVNFDDTKIAYAHLTSLKLLKAFSMFSLMHQKWLVEFGNKTLLKMSEIKLDTLVAAVAKPTIYDLFVGGPTLEKAKLDMEAQFKYNVQTVLDYGVEAKNEMVDFEANQKQILKSIEFAAKHDYVSFVVLKLSGLTNEEILLKKAQNVILSNLEQENWNQSMELVEEICAQAARLKVSLFVDAEESWIQGYFDELVLNLMKKYNRSEAIIWNTLQMYRKDRLEYLEEMIALTKAEKFVYGLKLVRGAYMEKERKRAYHKAYQDPIYGSKAETDQAFNQSLKLAIEHLDQISICVATHNEESCYLAIELMEDNKVNPSDPRICFSQLFGMGDFISYNLAQNGYNVSKYMPYGKVTDVIPYLMRRAEENTAVAGQVGRELRLLKKELKRRNLIFIS